MTYCRLSHIFTFAFGSTDFGGFEWENSLPQTQKVMVVVNTNTEKFVVVQSNELIEAAYSPAITARAHKVSRLIFSLISPSDTDFKLFPVAVETLKQYLGYSEEAVHGRFQQDLRDIADRLNKEPIVIKSEGKTTTAYLIAAYQIDWKSGVVTFEVPQLLKPFLLELKRNFTQYPLVFIPKLRSSYAIRLYELLYQYKNIGHRTLDLEDLQRKVGSNYQLYGDFKRKVLAISERDIRDNTDIRFEYEELKNSRKVTGIKFTILPNEPQGGAARKAHAPKNDTAPRSSALLKVPPADLELLQPPMPADLKNEYLRTGIADGVLENLWKLGFNLIDDAAKRSVAVARCKTSDTFFKEKLDLLRGSKTAGSTNPAGFLIKALHEDWVNPAHSKRETDRQQAAAQAAQKASAHERLRQIAHLRDQLKLEKDARKNQIYDQLLLEKPLLERAFQQAADGVGEETRSNFFSKKMSAEVLFREGGLAKNLIALQLEALRPELFSEINLNYQLDLVRLDDEEKRLRSV